MPSMLALTRWMADYYACSWGQALDAVVPAGVKKHAGTRIATFLMVPEEAREACSRGSINPPLTPKQAAVMEILGRGELLTMADVCRHGEMQRRADPRPARVADWCDRCGNGCRSGCRRLAPWTRALATANPTRLAHASARRRAWSRRPSNEAALEQLSVRRSKRAALLRS